MSLLDGTFNNIADIHRYSNEVYNGEMGDIDIYNEYADSFGSSSKIRITLDSKQTGTIVLAGSTNETITFSNRKTAESINFFTSLTGACCHADLTGEMKMELFDEQGSRIEILIYQGQEFCDFSEVTNEEKQHYMGVLANWQGKMDVSCDAGIELDDKIYIDDIETRYEVTSIITHRDKGLEQYKRIYLK